ncbi:hypothetical protein BASA60_005418 [Batrachochytrium salamandrivorans]|nr:hypothetical protein BASA60_005418 [Batrachochytrium salamandrivorans]
MRSALLCASKKTTTPKSRRRSSWHGLRRKHNTKVAQSTISGTLKRSAELLQMTDNVNLSQKRHRTVTYPQMEEALAEWYHANQGCVNMSGDLLKKSAKKILDRLYPDHAAFEFSNGWLESFKNCHGYPVVPPFWRERICQHGTDRRTQTQDSGSLG